MFLALLNLGPSELVLLLVLLVAFFGVDRLPEAARWAGRAKARVERAGQQWRRLVEDEEARLLREQLEFERLREQHVGAQQAPGGAEVAALRAAALDLGIRPDGLDAETLRARIAARVAEPPAGPEARSENEAA